MRNCPQCFPLFDKIEVNGPSASPVYSFLKESLKRSFPAPTNDVLWNFEKFLVDRTGKPVARFAPTDAPSSFEDKVVELL